MTTTTDDDDDEGNIEASFNRLNERTDARGSTRERAINQSRGARELSLSARKETRRDETRRKREKSQTVILQKARW